MILLHHNCDPKLANDKSLPYNAYLVEYEVDGEPSFDIVLCNKKVEIFDYYWDRYREDFKGFKQSEGRVNPKLWSNPAKQKNKK